MPCTSFCGPIPYMDCVLYAGTCVYVFPSWDFDNFFEDCLIQLLVRNYFSKHEDYCKLTTLIKNLICHRGSIDDQLKTEKRNV